MPNEKKPASPESECEKPSEVNLPRSNATIETKVGDVSAGTSVTPGTNSSSEAAFLQTFHSLPGLMCSLTPDMRVEFVNRPLLEYFGMTLEEMQGWKSTEIVHPDDLESLIAENRYAAEVGMPYEFERRCRRHDGAFRWLQMRGHPVRNEQGEIIRWYSLLIDVEDIKRAQEQLSQSEQRLKRIINSMPMLVWSADASGMMDFLNDKWLSYSGMEAYQALGAGWVAAIHPDDVPGSLALWKEQIVSGNHETAELEARFRRHDGEYRWFLVRASALRDSAGNIVNWFGTNIEIHDRKLAEQRIQRSEAFLAEAQRLMQVGSFFWCVETNELTWSRELYRIFQFEPGSVVTFERVMTRVHPDYRYRIENLMNQTFGKINTIEYENRLVMDDGSERILLVTIHRNYGRTERTEYLGTIADITARRQAEDELAKAQAELSRVARASSLGLLTASIAHEVSQPLVGILANASTCVRALDQSSPNIPTALQSTKRILRDANRASDVIGHLRNLFNQKHTNFEVFDLNECAMEILEITNFDIQRNRIALHHNFNPNIPNASGIRVQIQQVIINFIRNSIESLSVVDAKRRKIIIGTGFDESALWLSVEDSGTGFPAEVSARLFDPFFSTKADGMGIGLAVSRSIIEAHKGTLWATSSEDKGAIFGFRLPLSAGSTEVDLH
jgi:PAS domain S-box-containing protein